MLSDLFPFLNVAADKLEKRVWFDFSSGQYCELIVF